MSGRKRERGASLVGGALHLLASGLEGLASRARQGARFLGEESKLRTAPLANLTAQPAHGGVIPPAVPPGELGDAGPAPADRQVITFEGWFVAEVDADLTVQRAVSGYFPNRLAALPFLRWARNRINTRAVLIYERVYRATTGD